MPPCREHPKRDRHPRYHHIAPRERRGIVDGIEADRRAGAGVPHQLRARFDQQRRDKRAREAAERDAPAQQPLRVDGARTRPRRRAYRSEEHTSELQSLMRISYAVFCLKKKNATLHTKLYTVTHI